MHRTFDWCDRVESVTFLQAKRQRRDPRAFALEKQVEPAVNSYLFLRDGARATCHWHRRQLHRKRMGRGVCPPRPQTDK